MLQNADVKTGLKVAFVTLGCRLNQSESTLLEGVFRDRGCRVVNSGDPADIVVVNTCTVTSAGDSDARKAVNRAVRHNATVKVAVIGCQAQVQKEVLMNWPNVRWVVGTADKMRLADIILDNAVEDAAPEIIVPPIPCQPFLLPFATAVIATEAARTRAAIKVQDGCDRFCAYCEIPYARGRSRSRVFNNIMAEAGALAAAGYKELVITGVNVGDYQEKGQDLISILKGLESIKGIERIRISSIEHVRLPLELAKFMRSPHKLCRFLHLPVQSGCDRTLERMGRGYSCFELEKLLAALVAEVPGIMIGTDVIAGFPGETREDFEMTRVFLERVPFGYFHVFSYSPRQQARSRLFPDAVPADEIARRSRVLRALGEHKRQAFMKSMLGDTVVVLFEQKKKDYWIGHTDNYVTIMTNSSLDLRNRLVPVVLKKIDGDAVVGLPL